MEKLWKVLIMVFLILFCLGILSFISSYALDLMFGAQAHMCMCLNEIGIAVASVSVIGILVATSKYLVHLYGSRRIG